MRSCIFHPQRPRRFVNKVRIKTGSRRSIQQKRVRAARFLAGDSSVQRLEAALDRFNAAANKAFSGCDFAASFNARSNASLLPHRQTSSSDNCHD
jgi:hypothetical protein